MRYLNLKKTKKNSIREFLIISGALIIALAITSLYFSGKTKALFDPISIVSNVTKADLKETDGRTNILLLGSDERTSGVVTSVLTDTILVASIGKYTNDVVLISIPRDLWVEKYQSKVNALYTLQRERELRNAIETILGIPIHYYAVVNFDLFKETIDTLEGIQVDVTSAFDDYEYPVQGKEDAPYNERYETVHFDAGLQIMNGDAALKYVRSRHGNNNEGTDFARSKRQQKVITAIKDKALSLQTLLNITKLKELYDTYAKNVDTNINFGTIQNFYLLSQQIELDKVKSIVLDDRSTSDQGGLLYAPTDTSLYGGAYVLIPESGDYRQIHAYIQKYLFGE